jgi:glycosyltransferase involved in cell wall biosynthesis
MRVAASAGSLDVLLRGQLGFFNRRYEVVGVASPDGGVHRRIGEREGVRTVELNIERRVAPFSDLRSLVALWRLFRRERPSIVHSITPKAGLLSMVAAWAAGVPVRVHTFTGLIFPWRRGVARLLLRTTDRITCAFATSVIPEGEGVKHDLERYGVTRKPLHVLASGHVNGVDISYFQPVDRTDIMNDGERVTRFVYVGRVVKEKGIEILRGAFSRLRGAELVLVGPLEQSLDPLDEATLRWLQADDRVLHLGFREDVRPYLAAADVLVLPSLREGFPGTLLQAGAMGLPSIVTDICGCNEIVVDGETGVLVAPGSVDSLAAAMERLAADPEMCRRMGENARRRVVENYSQQRVWRALDEFYSDVSKGI